jgi:glutathione peroxidase-family protein
VSKEGEVIQRYSSITTPEGMKNELEKALNE